MTPFQSTASPSCLLGTGIAYFIGPFVSNSALYGTKMTFNVASLIIRVTSFESSDTYTSVSRRPQLIINYTPK